MPPITPFLWYNTDAEEAVNFYLTVFPNSRITSTTRYPNGFPGNLDGKVMTMGFELNGVPFTALNGGPHFKFNEAVSFVIQCEGQEDVDHYWNALTADGGQESQCGWLKDKWGLSWQVVPRVLPRILSGGGDAAASQRAVQAMMGMKKLVIADLEKAAAGS